MGRQIAIGATRNDLLPVLEQIYKRGYTFWGFNQYAPLADLESIKAYFLKKNGGLYLTLPQSEVKYMKNGWVAVHSSDVIEICGGSEGTMGFEKTPCFNCGRVYIGTYRSDHIFEKQPEFMVQGYKEICNLVRKNAVEKRKRGTETIWTYPEAKQIMDRIGW